MLSGKGLAAGGEPARARPPVAPSAGTQYIAGLLGGALSFVPRPDAKALAAMTARVFEISAYDAARAATPPGRPEGSPVPGARRASPRRSSTSST